MVSVHWQVTHSSRWTTDVSGECDQCGVCLRLLYPDGIGRDYPFFLDGLHNIRAMLSCLQSIFYYTSKQLMSIKQLMSHQCHLIAKGIAEKCLHLPFEYLIAWICNRYLDMVWTCVSNSSPHCTAEMIEWKIQTTRWHMNRSSSKHINTKNTQHFRWYFWSGTDLISLLSHPWQYTLYSTSVCTETLYADSADVPLRNYSLTHSLTHSQYCRMLPARVYGTPGCEVVV